MQMGPCVALPLSLLPSFPPPPPFPSIFPPPSLLSSLSPVFPPSFPLSLSLLPSFPLSLPPSLPPSLFPPSFLPSCFPSFPHIPYRPSAPPRLLPSFSGPLAHRVSRARVVPGSVPLPGIRCREEDVGLVSPLHLPVSETHQGLCWQSSQGKETWMQKTKMWSPAWEGLGTGTFQTVDPSPHAFLHLPIRLSIYRVHSFLHLLIYLFHTWSP